MTNYKMLGEIICHCSKCDLDLNHRITLMDGAHPSKVLCLTCKTEHKFRQQKPASIQAKLLRAKPIKSTQARQSFEEKEWRNKLNEIDVTPKKYNINENYSLNEIIYHIKFGRGLVINHEHPDKIHVFFDDGIKILKGKKADPALRDSFA